MIAKIISRKDYSEQINKLEIKISESLSTMLPGQYVLLRSLTGKGSITLPVIKKDVARETLTLMVASSEESDTLIDAAIADGLVEVEGAFGEPFRTDNCMIPLLPLVQTLRAAGNKITCLLTQNDGSEPVLESEILKYADHWITGDENPRRSSQQLEQAVRMQKYDQVFAIGHTKTIRESISICTATRTPIQAMLFLNSWNTKGKHGIFRVNACCKNHIICVDGHNFNAHYTNFEDLIKRFGNEEPELNPAEKAKISV
jgi:ferredoxin--NADP+ reductase